MKYQTSSAKESNAQKHVKFSEKVKFEVCEDSTGWKRVNHYDSGCTTPVQHHWRPGGPPKNCKIPQLNFKGEKLNST